MHLIIMIPNISQQIPPLVFIATSASKAIVLAVAVLTLAAMSCLHRGSEEEGSKRDDSGELHFEFEFEVDINKV
jgi:hypothetical protein